MEAPVNGGRKRIPKRDKVTAEHEALSQIAREAEAQLAAKRAARAEAREIRMKELEQQHKEMSDDDEWTSVGSRDGVKVDERSDRDFLDKGSRTMSNMASQGLSSHRGSGDTPVSMETEASIREMEDFLAESEVKYRKAMVSNAQLHNLKSTLMYQVDNLKEALTDMEEHLCEARRQNHDKSKECEGLRRSLAVLQFHLDDVRQMVSRSQDLLTKHGVFVVPEVTTNGDTGRDEDLDDSGSRLVQEPSQAVRENMLVLQIQKVVEERESLQDQVQQLRSLSLRTGEVQDPPEDGLGDGVDCHMVDWQRDATRQISDLKFKLVQSEQDVAVLQQNVVNLEGQVARYKSSSENAERIEDQLKVEKRKLQRELRSALDQVDELEVAKGHLTKRLEKMKANRSALLAQQ